jgi:predicted amidohydrolase
MHPIRLALAQARDGHDLAELHRFVAEAEAAEADLLLLPEGHLRGDQLNDLRHEAARRGVWVAAGVDLDKPRRRTAVLVSDEGALVGQHQKTRQTEWEAEAGFVTAERMEPFATPWGAIGFALCHELYHPEVSHAYAETGASLILNPIDAGMYRDAWRVEWRAKAQEQARNNRIFVAGVSHYDSNLPFGYCYGPDGDELLHMEAVNELGLCNVDLSLCGHQLRPELSSLETEAAPAVAPVAEPALAIHE